MRCTPAYLRARSPPVKGADARRSLARTLRATPAAGHDRYVNRSLFFASLLVAACEGPLAPPDAGTDAGPRDAGPLVEYWPGTLPRTSELGERRGRSIARATVHLHSPLSHDACDGEGWVDGELADPACLAHLRAAMCALHLDAAMLTDHAPHLEEVSIERALWLEAGDEPLRDAEGNVVAGRIACDDGHRVLVTAGSENQLMPLGLERHPGDPSDPAALVALYDSNTPDAVAAFRAAGALVWQAHTEGRTLDELRAIDLDGLEIYNIHANVAPDIREEHLGLPPTSFFRDLLDFTDARFRLPPDLAVLAFLSENQPALDRWDALLSEGAHIAGTAGADAHENTFTMLLPDGERADSYRRMMIWVQNHLLVDDATPEGIDDALVRGRLYVTFEVFGTPVGFDFVAEDASATFEMGDDAPVGATLRLTRPSLPEGFPADPPPIVTMRILRATATGAVEVASGDGATLEHVTTEAGAYRAEVRMIPEHARPVLGSRGESLIRELPWVYSNPIFVTAP